MTNYELGSARFGTAQLPLSEELVRQSMVIPELPPAEQRDVTLKQCVADVLGIVAAVASVYASYLEIDPEEFIDQLEAELHIDTLLTIDLILELFTQHQLKEGMASFTDVALLKQDIQAVTLPYFVNIQAKSEIANHTNGGEISSSAVIVGINNKNSDITISYFLRMYFIRLLSRT